MLDRRPGSFKRSASGIALVEIVRSLARGNCDAVAMLQSPWLESIRDSITVVQPACRLKNFRFTYFGQSLTDRFGDDLTGLTFGSVPDFESRLSACFEEFETARRERRIVSSQRHCNFSMNWVIEYSRTIVPILRDGEVGALVAGYVFHDSIRGPCTL